MVEILGEKSRVSWLGACFKDCANRTKTGCRTCFNGSNYKPKTGLTLTVQKKRTKGTVYVVKEKENA